MTEPGTYQPTEIINRMTELAGLPLASFQRRAVALILDLVISFLLFLLGLLIVGIIIWYSETSGRFTTYSFSFDVGTWYGRVIIQILVPIFYFGIMTWLTNGRTLGKMMLGIRVVSLTHDRIRLWDCIERALGYAASIAELGFGFWQYFTHPQHRTAQDCLAETIVVREEG